MPYATLRFYGRFVVAEALKDGKPAGKASFLVPNMTTSATPGRKFAEHHARLSVPRAALNRDRTTFAPIGRVMSDVRASFAETLVWDLTGWNIVLDGNHSFALDRESGSALVELTSPVPAVTYPPKIDQSGLAATAAGLSTAVIHLCTGQGRAFASFKNNYNFVTESDAHDNNPINDRPLGVDGQLADAIEVIVEADVDKQVRLRVYTLQGTHGEICIDARNFNPTVSFTNLCPTLPHDIVYDYEFGRYYDYFQNPPIDAPVPAMVPTGGDPGDCNEPAHFFYEP